MEMKLSSDKVEIRYLQPSDEERITDIYHHFFTDMEFPDFFSGYHCVFVAHKNDKVISIGGLRPIAEAVVVTDYSSSVRERVDALLQIHNGLTYAAEKLKYKRIYAFTFDQTYTKHLVNRMNFTPIRQSQLLVLELPNG